MAKKGLGKGLGAIISTSTKPVEEMEKELVEFSGGIHSLKVEEIDPNPDQPRSHFDEDEIRGLAESIKAVGLIQPIVVRRHEGRYLVVAGERRLRATKLLELPTIKAIIIEADEVENLSMALIENIQRASLDPIEEAKAYRMLINRFKLRQQDVADRVGKDRATVANSLRLLNLPDEIQEGLSSGAISTGHAKVLLGAAPESQLDLFRQVVDKGLSVRALEAMVQKTAADGTDGDGDESVSRHKDPHIRRMEEELVSRLGTKVTIKHSGNKGRIEINYYSLDDFERIVEIIK